MLVRRVSIFGLLASSMILSFGGILLLYLSSSSRMRHRRVGMSCQSLMMIFPLYYMSDPVPYSNTSQPASTSIVA